jgi:hypothetical protein
MNTNEFDDLIISNGRGKRSGIIMLQGGKAYEEPTQSGHNKCIQSYFCAHVIDGERGKWRKNRESILWSVVTL